ncbi:hydroxyacid dehydrogenase [Kribbella sp. NPDC050281]|uniref:hydroxyacid dehydrogenase n=1 Tax=Kribbella sp. NPDC050281 TaxID=3155515 RepID=UPI0033CE0C33
MVLPVVYVDLPRALEAELFGDGIEQKLRGIGRLVRRGDGSVDGDSDARLRAEVLITGWGSAPLPERLGLEDRLRLVVHSAGTIRALAPQGLLSGGVRVSQASAGMAQSVAELALYMTIARLRDLDRIDRAMVGTHDWTGADFGLGRTLADAAVGVVGASRVGRAYLRLVVAAGSEVLVYDPYLDDQEAKSLGARLVPLETLVSQSVVVALHAPVREETRHMLDAQTLALIPDGGLVINTARAALVDTDALLDEVRSGRLSAAVDVFDEEPLPPDSEWWQLPNVLLTPHLGARTWHSRRTQGAIVIDEIRRYLNGLDLRHEVLPDTYDLMA